MTVKELIEKLSRMPEGALIVTYDGTVSELTESEGIGLVTDEMMLEGKKLRRLFVGPPGRPMVYVV